MQRPSTAPSPATSSPSTSSTIHSDADSDISATALAFSDPNSTTVLSTVEQVNLGHIVATAALSLRVIQAAQAVGAYIAAAAQPVPVAPRDASFLGQVNSRIVVVEEVHANALQVERTSTKKLQCEGVQGDEPSPLHWHCSRHVSSHAPYNTTHCSSCIVPCICYNLIPIIAQSLERTTRCASGYHPITAHDAACSIVPKFICILRSLQRFT
jgi:hypothetical protein